MEQREFVVVGAGLLGLAAARAVARRGRDVLVLEAATVGNDHAGSKGTARIFRYGYEDPFYVRLAMRAHRLWHELEGETERELLVPTGQLNFGTGLGELESAMSACGAPQERLPAGEVAERFPGLAPREAIFEPSSGVLEADECLAALRSAGSGDLELRSDTSVQRVTDEGDSVRIETTKGDVSAATAIVCAGARTGAIASGVTAMPVQRSTLEQVAYIDGGTRCLPIVIDRAGELLYGLPDGGRDAYKVGLHHRGPEVLPSPGAPLADDPHLLDELGRAVRANFPEWEGEVVGSERCFYDTTEDEDFVIDRLGHIVVGCGTSGHGFKFGPLVGELLADLALTGTLGDEYARFRLRRGR